MSKTVYYSKAQFFNQALILQKYAKQHGFAMLNLAYIPHEVSELLWYIPYRQGSMDYNLVFEFQECGDSEDMFLNKIYIESTEWPAHDAWSICWVYGDAIKPEIPDCLYWTIQPFLSALQEGHPDEIEWFGWLPGRTVYLVE